MNFDSLNYRNNSKIGRTILIGNEVKNTPPMKDNQGFITFLNDNHVFSMNKDDLSKGVLLVGSPGSGKTNVIMSMLDSIIPSLSDDDCLIIFDSKADFYDRYFNADKQNHILISASDEHARLSKSWNIFGELTNESGGYDSAELIAHEISLGLFRNLESESQPFFSIAAASVFDALLCCFVKNAERSNDYSILNNSELIKFVKASSVSDIYNLLSKYPEYNYVKSYLGNSNNLTPQALGVMGYLNSMVNTLFIGPFKNKSQAGEFSIRKIVREKGAQIVFIEYDMLLGETLAPLYSQFIDLAIKEGLKNGKGNTYLILDELNLVPYCEQLQFAVNVGRGRGLKTVVGLQNVNQLYDNYGEDKGKAIAAGFVNAFCFNSADFDTRKFISERFGKTFESVNYLGSNLTREGFSVEDHDIHNLNVGEAFIDLANTQPFKFRFGKIM